MAPSPMHLYSGQEGAAQRVPRVGESAHDLHAQQCWGNKFLPGGWLPLEGVSAKAQAEAGPLPDLAQESQSIEGEHAEPSLCVHVPLAVTPHHPW